MNDLRFSIKMYFKIKWFFLSLIVLIISPIWVLLIALWEIKDDVLYFYKSIYLGLTFRLNHEGRRHK
tara:strand:- start:428 stop:628 length:201 start_codon:yes stop_codon:yes gene_type:complete